MRRYPGSTPFQVEDERVFKGRRRETHEVLNLILTHKMLVLFARSGIGKTSLINAGVVPKLDEYGYYPIFVRFNDLGAGKTSDPAERLQKQYQLDHGKINEQGSFQPQPTLWETLYHNPLIRRGKELVPVIILDQFEEFFNTYSTEQRAVFLRQMANILADFVPQELALTDGDDVVEDELTPLNLRVVFSIRADLLSHMQEVSTYVPFVMRTRYQLNPLNEKQARESIREPGEIPNDAKNAENPYQTGPITFPDPIIDDILMGLKDTRAGDIEVESFQLQLVCSHLEDEYVRKAGGPVPDRAFTVTKEDYGGIPGILEINKKYFSDTIDGIKEQPRRVVIDQLVNLLNNNGNRILREDSQLALEESVKEKLVDKRILKRDVIQGVTYYEISHDKIALTLQPEKERIKKRRDFYRMLLFGAVGLAILLFGLYSLNQARTIAGQNDALNIKNETLNSQKLALDTLVASLTKAKEKLIRDSLDLKKNYDLVKAQTASLRESIKKLNQAKLGKAWNDYDNALQMMRAKLFDQALVTFPDPQQLAYNAGKIKIDFKREFARVEKRTVQAKRICQHMKEVQHLVEQAECLQLSLRITCANQLFQKALVKQNNYADLYGPGFFYFYPIPWLNKKIETTNKDIARFTRIGLNDADLKKNYPWLNDQLLEGINDPTKTKCVCTGIR